MKTPALVLVACTFFGYAAAARGAMDSKTPPVDPPAIATRFVDLLAAGRFAEAVNLFDPTMKESLPAEKLREVWETLNTQAGPYRERTGVRAATESKYRVIFVACRFEKTVLEAKVVFDSKQRIAGLFFLPPPAASEYAPPDYARPATYREKEVRVEGDGGPLPGTLSLPAVAGPVPGIVLVHGSGPLDRDETIGPNRPFRDLASGLASRGIAVLRYDKRTRVYAERLQAERERITLQEETVLDAAQAVRLLRRSRGVDGARVFVLGHSLGGAALPRIASLERGIAGFVMLATPSRPLLQAYADQMAYLAALDGVVTDEERARLEAVRRQVERASGPAPPGAAAPEDLPLGLGRAYWDDLRRIDALGAAARLDAPILVLQGGRDYQVTAADFEGWRRVLAQRPDVSWRLYPALNHLFMKGEGPPSPAEYEVASHVAAEVIEDLAAWLKGAHPPSA